MRKYITPEEAISLLPDKDMIHTFYNHPRTLLGADWDREDIIEKLKEVDKIELTGENARKMGHGIAVYNDDIKWQSEVLFVETDEEKINAFDPMGESDEQQTESKTF